MSGSSHHSEFEQDPFSSGKLAFLGVVTFALAATQALVPLAPVPLAMAYLLFGLKSGIAVSIVCFISAYILASIFPAMATTMATIILVSIIAFFVAKIILTKEHPIVGLVKSGVALLGGLLFLALMINLVTQDGLRGEVSAVVDSMVESFQSSEQNREFLESNQGNAPMFRDLVENPERIVTNIMRWAFGMVFVSVFLGLWISLFLVLRNSLIWRQKLSYPYELDHLIKFRMPDQAVWPLIAGLFFYVGSSYGLPEVFAVIGGNLLICLAIFYFFQGFGLYYDVLTHYNIKGFFRSLLVVTAVLFAWEVIVIGGVFDMWINFRKFLNKSDTDKGDMS